MDSDIRIIRLEPFFRTDKLRTPLKFGGVVVEESTSMIVKASVQNKRGEMAEGFGSMPLIDQWAFPEPSVPHERKLEAMKLIGEAACKLLERRWSEKFAHPIDIMLETREEILGLGGRISREARLEVRMPVLGILVATSPIDAAIHDAFGRVNGICSFEGYGPRFMEHDLGFYLGSDFRGRYPSDCLRQRYAESLPVFHLVGALDKLRREEVDASDPRDGLPVSLEEWIERDGVFCLKVKLSGIDVEWDVKRTVAVAEVAREVLDKRGITTFYLSADANEMNPDPGTTLEYLRRLREASPMAFSRLLYLEQPTERDLAKRRFSMREVAELKPVFADEGVTDLETFDLALRLGWSGIAVKVCKWHSSSLLYIAKMEHYGIPYSIQDLTCTGLALVHSAALAARTKPLMGFEYNARQYLPFAFKELQRRHESLFFVKDGYIRTDSLTPLGLGFSVERIEDLL